MRKLTKEIFVNKSNLVHDYKYSYEKSVYVNNSTKVIITCGNHGDFLQQPQSHMCGSGCPKCANDKRNENRKKDTKTIIYEFKNTHGLIYDYSMVVYSSYHNKVKIMCRNHGVFEQSPSDHIRGSGCSKCKFQKQSEKRSMTIDDFISKSIKVHGLKYNYDNVVLKNGYSKVSIICPIHGSFVQTAYKHTSGQGCRFCGVNSAILYNKRNPTGWDVCNWENASKTSKNFDSFKVYVIRCWNDNEEFYKIGRTFTTVKRRFRGHSVMPYRFEIISEYIFNTAKDAFCREIDLKRKNLNNKYVPKIKFNGMHECFSKINFDLI